MGCGISDHEYAPTPTESNQFRLKAHSKACMATGELLYIPQLLRRKALGEGCYDILQFGIELLADSPLFVDLL